MDRDAALQFEQLEVARVAVAQDGTFRRDKGRKELQWKNFHRCSDISKLFKPLKNY